MSTFPDSHFRFDHSRPAALSSPTFQQAEMARFGIGTFMKWNIMTGPIVGLVGVFGLVTTMTIGKEVRAAPHSG